MGLRRTCFRTLLGLVVVGIAAGPASATVVVTISAPTANQSFPKSTPVTVSGGVSYDWLSDTRPSIAKIQSLTSSGTPIATRYVATNAGWGSGSYSGTVSDGASYGQVTILVQAMDASSEDTLAVNAVEITVSPTGGGPGGS